MTSGWIGSGVITDEPQSRDPPPPPTATTSMPLYFGVFFPRHSRDRHAQTVVRTLFRETASDKSDNFLLERPTASISLDDTFAASCNHRSFPCLVTLLQTMDGEAIGVVEAPSHSPVRFLKNGVCSSFTLCVVGDRSEV